MQIHPEFPQHRRQDPRRRREATVYDQLARSELPGHGLYGLKASPSAPEVDFALWIEDEGRFGIQVKGGHYTVDNTVWHLHTPAGADLVSCPLTQTWDGVIGIRDALYLALNFKIFVIPVLLLTDMEPEPTIEEWAAARRYGSSGGPGTWSTACWRWPATWGSSTRPRRSTSAGRWRRLPPAWSCL